jgi:hypothetical protein
MDELNDLIRQQASYSSLVAWVQKRTGRSYGTVCEEGDECSDPWRDKDFH